MSWTSCFFAKGCPAAPVQIAATYRRQTSKVSHKTYYVSSKHAIVSASCSWSPGSTRLAISWKIMERSRTRRLPTCRNAAPNLSTHWSRLRTQEDQWPACLFFPHAFQLKSAVSSLAPIYRHLGAKRTERTAVEQGNQGNLSACLLTTFPIVRTPGSCSPKTPEANPHNHAAAIGGGMEVKETETGPLRKVGD